MPKTPDKRHSEKNAPSMFKSMLCVIMSFSLSLVMFGCSSNDNTVTDVVKDKHRTIINVSAEDCIEADTSGDSSPLSSTGEVYGDSNEEKIWNYLKSAGFSDASAAGIMANIKHEGGFDPSTIQGGGAGPAAGMFQWENFNNKTGRWKALDDFARSHGSKWDDIAMQLEFAMTEMASNFDNFTGKTYTYSNGTQTWWPNKVTLDEFKQMSDPAECAEIFERTYERPSIPHREERKASALEFYEQFSGHSYTGSTAVSEACSGENGQKFGASAIEQGEKYIQFQGHHYHDGKENSDQGIDTVALKDACGATSFIIGVNMLLGQVHKYCGVETWRDMGSDSTGIGWNNSSLAPNWLSSKGLDSQIEVTGIQDVNSAEDLKKKLSEGNVCVVSSAGNVFKNKDGSMSHSTGHYVLFYKYANGTFYVDDCRSEKAGGGIAYSETDVNNFFNSSDRNGGGSCSIKRK